MSRKVIKLTNYEARHCPVCGNRAPSVAAAERHWDAHSDADKAPLMRHAAEVMGEILRLKDMSAEKVLKQVALLEALLKNGTPRPWWNSHGEPYAGDKANWDLWEALKPEDDEPEHYSCRALFNGDVEHEPDTALIVAAVNALPALLELKRAAAEWAVALLEIHQKTFTGPGPHPELEVFQQREHRLAELALVVLEGL